MSNLGALVLRRIAYGAVALFLLVTAVFFLSRQVGDPVVFMAGPDASAEVVAEIRQRLGLDRPVHEQYVQYMGELLRGDFGTSYRGNRPALSLVLERLPATLELTAVAMVLAAVIAIPIGVVSAVRPGSLVDSVARVVAVLGQSMPVFWLGILLIIVFAVNLGWLPAGGRESWRHLVLPGLALSVYSIPLTMRLTRSTMIEVMSKDYIRTAESKGLQSWRVLLLHGLRNALLPIITVLTLRLGTVITGAIVLEEVFAYPGLGRLAIQALLFGDFPVVQAFLIVVAISIIGINLIADVLYGVADPRIRVSG